MPDGIRCTEKLKLTRIYGVHTLCNTNIHHSYNVANRTVLGIFDVDALGPVPPEDSMTTATHALGSFGLQGFTS
jgi:hypothetical protein